MPKDKSRPTRTQIWVEGRQHARLDARAFGRASLSFGRESLSGLLDRCALSAAGLGTRIAEGQWRVPEARLGRTGRFLPDHRRVAGAIGGLAAVLGRSAGIVLPGAPAKQISIFDAAPPVVAVAPHHAAPASEDPSLDAIRRMMLPEGPSAPRQVRAGGLARLVRPEPEVAEVDELPAPPARLRWMTGMLTEATARALGYGLLVLSLPWGAARATLAHLSGQDLRKLED